MGGCLYLEFVTEKLTSIFCGEECPPMYNGPSNALKSTVSNRLLETSTRTLLMYNSVLELPSPRFLNEILYQVLVWRIERVGTI